MVKFFATFSRVIALVLLVTFTFVTCSMPSGSKPEEEKIVITPGEGTPTYFYMNPDGSVSDTPTERIGLYIEDNKNAEGVLVVADKEGVNERVTVYNETNNSVVVTYFEPNHKWPSYMNIKIGDETAKGFIGYYKEETSTYDISFMGNGEVQTLQNLVFNKNIFTVYQDNPDFTPSINGRVRNITVAMGLWGSLYNALDGDEDTGVSWGKYSVDRRGFWSTIKRGLGHVKNTFNNIALAATIVATVVAPIVYCFNPVIGIALYEVSAVVVTLSGVISSAASKVSKLLPDDPSEDPDDPPSDQDLREMPIVNVMVKYGNQNRPLVNGEEFHISKGEDVLLHFSSPNPVVAQYTEILHVTDWVPYEPGTTGNGNTTNFSMPPIFIREGLNPDEFQVKIERVESGCNGAGKLWYAFKPLGARDIVLNDSEQPVDYKLSTEASPTTHKDLVVVKFCLIDDCPDK